MVGCGCSVTPSLADRVMQARLAQKRGGNVRAWSTAGVFLVLLIVNSLGKGVVFVARWTDASGFSVVQQSTGFWTQTTGTSATNGPWKSTTENFFFGPSGSSSGDIPAEGGERKDYHWSLVLGSQLASEGHQATAPEL